MRTYTLTEGHPALKLKCPICAIQFKAQDRVILILLRPAGKEDVERAKEGRPHIQVGELAHVTCNLP